MCFSAEASFTAAAVLAIVGCGALKAAKKPKTLRFLALVPFLLALQQFSEGILWLYLKNGSHPAPVSLTAQYLFLFFAMLIWPIWIPLSFAVIETVRWRYIVICCALAAGIFWSGACILSLLDQEISSQIVKNHIQYIYKETFPTELYAAIILIPCFVSSLKKAWIFGALIAVSAMASHYIYTGTFTSVWCFFSAIISLFLYIVIRHNTSKEYSSHV